MKDVVRHLSEVVAIGLVVLGVLVFLMPTAETYTKIIAIVGFIAAVLILVSVEWWRRDEEYYEEKLQKKEQRARVRTHI